MGLMTSYQISISGWRNVGRRVPSSVGIRAVSATQHRHLPWHRYDAIDQRVPRIKLPQRLRDGVDPVPVKHHTPLLLTHPTILNRPLTTSQRTA